jgi:hypothetical protein
MDEQDNIHPKIAKSLSKVPLGSCYFLFHLGKSIYEP